jgi:hypothetical protein
VQKGILMPAIRNATVLLQQAVERLESGDVVSAGCHAREALRRHLRELCDQYDCRPSGHDQSARAFITALSAIGVLGKSRRRALKRLDSTCRGASRLLQVRPNRMRRAIGLVRVALCERSAVAEVGAMSEQLPPLQTNGSGDAYVTINGRDHILGKVESTIAQAEHARLMAEYRASGYSTTYGLPVGILSVAELIGAYLEFARNYYGTDSRCEYANVEAAVRRVRELYGHCQAVDFGPLQLKTVRQTFLDDDGARTYINDRCKRIVRMFRWGVSEGLLPPAIPQALSMVPGLRRGRTTAREPRRILPADPALVDATLPQLHPTVRAMVTLQRLTAARPGEICILRPCDVNRDSDVWEYRPSSHKNANRGKERVYLHRPKGAGSLAAISATRAGPFLLFGCAGFRGQPRERTGHPANTQDAALP